MVRANHPPIARLASCLATCCKRNGSQHEKGDKEIIKRAKPDAEMRPAEEPGAIIPHARICEGVAR